MKKDKKKPQQHSVGVSTKSYKPGQRSGAQNTAALAKTTAADTWQKHRPIIIIVGSVLVVAIVIGIILAVVLSSAGDFDFLKADLGKYISISRSDYSGYTVEVNVPPVSDDEVEQYVIEDLAEGRGDSLYATYMTDKVINAGDKVYIWCRGYELGEDGVKTDVAGTSNLFQSKPTELTVGSGDFFVGFETGLVGKIPNNYGSFVKVTEGDILPTDTVYINCTYATETGSEYFEDVNIRIELSDPELEAKYGIGFCDYIKSIGIGGSTATDAAPKDMILAGTDNHITFVKASVKFVTRSEANPLTVKTVFPRDDEDETLAGKTVYFDVFIEKAWHYKSAELTDEYITEKLGISAESLAEYEGQTLAEKYRAGVRAMLEAGRKEEVQAAAEEAVWNHLLEAANIIELPRRAVDQIYDSYYYALRMQYSEYLSMEDEFGSAYETLEQFIAANYELSDVSQVESHLRSLAEQEAKEKLIFYYILREENMLPTEEEYNTMYKSILKNEYDSIYHPSEELKANEEYYESAIRAYERQALNIYGENYYKDAVYYNYAMDRISELATVVNLAQSAE